MIEKKSPHHDLVAIKSQFSTVAGLSMTGSATRDAAGLGCGTEEVVATIQRVERGHFYKSMTAYHSNKVWQDVYRVPDGEGFLYVKFTDNGTPGAYIVLSFKEWT